MMNFLNIYNGQDYFIFIYHMIFQLSKGNLFAEMILHSRDIYFFLQQGGIIIKGCAH